MIHQALLRRVVVGREAALVDFVETVAPLLLQRFVSVPALGGSGRVQGLLDPCLPEDIQSIAPEAYRRFSQMHDQSMLTHTLNGVFAAMRLMEKLPDSKALDDLEQRLWLMGYVCHDYTKVYGIKVQADNLPLIRKLITCLGDSLNFTDFCPTWHEYLDDIVFLAQNTQTVEGANLNLRDFSSCKTSPRRLEVLRLLSSIADILVHITSPSDVILRGSDDRDRATNLRTKMMQLFGAESAPRFVYHRLTEVRGLLSNLINNSAMESLKELGCEPFLYFANGVVYLADKDIDALLVAPSLPDSIWQKIVNVLMYGEAQHRPMISTQDAGAASDDDVVEDEEQTNPSEASESEVSEESFEGGLGIQPKRNLKFAPILYEILSIEQLITEGRRAAMNLQGTVAFDRFVSQVTPEKTDYLRNVLKGNNMKAARAAMQKGYEEEFEAIFDNRTDILAEFLAFIWRRVLNERFGALEKKLADQAKQSQETNDTRKGKQAKGHFTSALILDWLGISDLVMPEDASFQKGSRIPTGWYVAAAKYMGRNSALDLEDMDSLLAQIGRRLTEYLSEQNLVSEQETTYQSAFLEYTTRLVEINGLRLTIASSREAFEGEIKNYLESKAANKLVCSMCMTPLGSHEQTDSVVLFKGQQYSNKGRLSGGQVKRGICPICSIEMLLRQIQQGLPSKQAEDDKSIFVYLYPVYFFTPETAKVVKFFLNDLDDLNLSPLSATSLIRHLRTNGFQMKNVLNYDSFLVEAGVEPTTYRRLLMQAPQYSEHDATGMFVFSLKPRKPAQSGGKTAKITDTDAWILPTLFGLTLPQLLNVKAVVTPSFVPIFSSGADFKETTVLDAPHGFTQYILGRDRFRVDEIEEGLIRLLQLYHLHLSVFAEPKNMHWAQLNAVAKDVMTDPYYVFAYYDRKHRSESKTEEDDGAKKQSAKGKKKGGSKAASKGIPVWDIENFINIYLALGGNKTMGFIGELVDAYAQFYRADFSKLDSTYAVLRPLMTAIEAAQDSDPAVEEDDLLLLIAGAVNDDQIRVRSDSAEGFDPIVTNTSYGTYGERLTLSRLKIEEFARLFVEKAFHGYCHGDRALLRERANRIRSAARFYYLQHYSRN